MINLETEQYISVPRRGIRVVAPPELQDVLASIRQRQQNHTPLPAGERSDLWTAEQKARLNLLLKCKILARRFPTPRQGEIFMEDVDKERRGELLTYVEELTENIMNSWTTINPEKQIAIILYGSVAKGLVKSRFHPDPSNIDMAVIGDFSLYEKEDLLSGIRKKREEIAGKIRSSSPNIDYSIVPTPGNVGIVVQNIELLRRDRFGETRAYIASGAFALHDPANIWQELSQNAIITQQEGKPKKQRLDYRQTIFTEEIH